MSADTIKIDKKFVRMIAHRGLSGIERENTAAAFVAAGNRSYYGIETDIHATKDGKYVVCHDDNLLRVSGVDITVEESTLAELQSIPLTDRDGTLGRIDLRTPTLEDYISICKKYGKTAVLELKNEFSYVQVAEIVGIIDKLGYLDSVTFISFCLKNLLNLRHIVPGQSAQFLFSEPTEEILKVLAEERIDADVRASKLTREVVESMHALGLTVNCWTVDDPEEAKKLIEMGVDQITTNILE